MRINPDNCKCLVGIILVHYSLLSCSEPVDQELTVSNKIYVAMNGDDKNNGTFNSPLKSISTAIKIASENEAVVIRGGEYDISETIIIKNKRHISIESASNEQAVLNFTSTATYGILIGENSSWIYLTGLQLKWSSISNGNIIGVGGKNITIKNNYISFADSDVRTKYDGIKILSTADNISIEYNKIDNAPQQCIDSVGGARIHIKNNLLLNCANGIVLKGGARNNVIENNIAINMKHGAIGIGGTTDQKFVEKEYENSNTIVNNNLVFYENANNIGGGIFLQGAVAAEVFNNTLIGGGIHIKNGGNPDNPLSVSKNNKIWGNIIWRTGNDGIIVVDENNSIGLTLEDNCYWKTSGSGEFKINGQWYNYQAFKAEFTLDSNSKFEDPLFKDVLAFDYALLATSPCFGKGIAVILEFPQNSINGNLRAKTSN